MFKSSNSLYVAGARDTEWMKLKPDYIHDMGDELDLLIIAGYYGEGCARLISRWRRTRDLLLARVRVRACVRMRVCVCHPC